MVRENRGLYKRRQYHKIQKECRKRKQMGKKAQGALRAKNILRSEVCGYQLQAEEMVQTVSRKQAGIGQVYRSGKGLKWYGLIYL